MTLAATIASKITSAEGVQNPDCVQRSVLAALRSATIQPHGSVKVDFAASHSTERLVLALLTHSLRTPVIMVRSK